MVQINFKLALQSDHKEVWEFICKEFIPYEPLQQISPSINPQDLEFDEEELLSSTIIMAYDDEKLIGILRTIPLLAKGLLLVEDGIATRPNIKWKYIEPFIAYLENKTDICRRFKVQKSLEIYMVAVAVEYRGQQIGQKLFRKGFELAKDLKYPLVNVDCTTAISIRIAEQLGMEFVSEVTFDEYNAFCGKEIFKADTRQSAVKSFVKRIV